MYEVIEFNSLFYVMTEADDEGFQGFIGASIPAFASRNEALAWIAESL